MTLTTISKFLAARIDETLKELETAKHPIDIVDGFTVQRIEKGGAFQCYFVTFIIKDAKKLQQFEEFKNQKCVKQMLMHAKCYNRAELIEYLAEYIKYNI